jgi:hypothetical protein
MLADPDFLKGKITSFVFEPGKYYLVKTVEKISV